MHRLKLVVAVLTLALVASACGGSDEISASTCDDIVDETIDLVQRLIDDLDAEFAELSIQEFVAQAEDLEPFEPFREDSAAIVALSESLGCADSEIATGVSLEVGRLTSKTVVGRFMIDAIISGSI
jgi:hypothetical protein